MTFSRDLKRLTLIALAVLGGLVFLMPASKAQASAGSLDPDFINPNVDGTVTSIALQPNGKILIGGVFSQVGGEARNRVARLNADGSLDGSFRDPNVNGTVDSIALQPDGKVLIGGEFTRVGDEARGRVARLNADGSLDGSFANPKVAGGPVRSIALQPDGKVLIGGAFNLIGTTTRIAITRLNSNGSLDGSFANPGLNGSLWFLTRQPDGKVLIGGEFTRIGLRSRSRITRLDGNGSLDTNFKASANNTVRTIALRSNGRILIGGSFTEVDGEARSRTAGLNADGTIDRSFANPLTNDQVYSVATESDGEVLLGGDFTQVGGQPRERVERLLTNGLPDPSFINPAVGGRVDSLAPQPNGRTLVAGQFGVVQGQERNNIARLIGTSFPLTVTKSGTGVGTVASSPRGINCGTQCSTEFEEEARVTLTAEPADGAQFNGWGGACAGKSPTCEVLMSQALEVSATFGRAENPERLEVAESGPGKIVSAPAGIDCGKDCLQFKSRGSFVTLFAEPNDDARFTGWSGDCSGESPSCNLWMTGTRSVTGTFKKLPPDAKYLTVTRLGSGAGSVTSTPAGINCGENCVQGFVDGTKVTLKANPAENARFSGWGGACSGSGATCTVTMNQTRGVTASFEELPADSPVLTVTKSGTGSGSVSSSPPGINCGPDCRQAFLQGSKVTLTAKPRAGAQFSGWTGACSGASASCSVTMGQSLEVGAAFTQFVTLEDVRSKKQARSLKVVSRLSVAFPGKITQRVTTGAKRKQKTWCKASKSARRASTQTVRCNLGRKARARVKKRALQVSVRTTFKPRGSKSVTIVSPLRIRRG